MAWTILVSPPATPNAAATLGPLATALDDAVLRLTAATPAMGPQPPAGQPVALAAAISLDVAEITFALGLAGLLEAQAHGDLPPFQLRIAIAGDLAGAESLLAGAGPGQVLVSPAARRAAEVPPHGGYYRFEPLEGPSSWLFEPASEIYEYLYDSRLSRLDGPFRQVFAAEIDEWVGPRRRQRGRRAVGSPAEPRVDNGLVGIALSGGGQRSAVFSLGVCQALARYGLLAEADYLATVSGGGYLGASIQALCAEPVPYVDVMQTAGAGRFGADPHDFPYAFPRDPDPGPPADLPIHGLESPALWHVRKHANLLGNRIGLLDTETWSTLYRYLGGMLLSWILFLVPLPLLATGLGVWVWDEWLEEAIRDSQGSIEWWLILVPPFAAIAIEAIVYLAAGKAVHRAAASAVGRGVVLAFALAPVLWLVYTGLGGAVYLIVDANRGGTEFKSLLGALGGVSAAATTLGVTGVTRTPGEGKAGLASRILFLFGGYILLGVLIVLLAWGAWALFQVGPHWTPRLPVLDREPHVAIPFSIVMAAAGITVLAMLVPVANRAAGRLLNWLSIHSVYQGRVTDTWVIAANPPGASRPPAAVHRWSDVWPRPDMTLRDLAAAPAAAPYPLVCATINIPGSRGEKLPERKGDSFVLAPLYSGSASTRWVRTGRDEFEYRSMALGRAATISGAAFSPNMGEKSTRTLSILMTIFNARIGRWCDNPRLAHRKHRSALKLYYKELFANPSRDDHQVYLSDGGHFENLGLYELVRRRCKYILAVTADTEKGEHDRHGNLATATRLVREDFGVQVEVPSLAPITRDKDGAVLSSYAVGRILYPKARLADGTPIWDEGTLIVIKTGMVPPKMSVDLVSHWRTNPDFPYTQTTDQQFDQGQFEAYRQLGYLAGRAVGQAASPASLSIGLRFSQVAARFAETFPSSS